MTRKLASIQTVSAIQPIPDADKIEVAIINGWEVVTKKGEFTPGDRVLYFEIDAFLPVHPDYEFLRKSSYRHMGKKDGFRLKTIRLRGQISQGLVVPVPEKYRSVDVGTDLTDELGVLLYEIPIPAQLAGKVKGDFPSFIAKTDEERVQNLVDELPSYQDIAFYVTEKLDGTCVTYYLNNGEFGVCTRNLEILETEENAYWKVARNNKIEEKLRAFGQNMALQGEIIGSGIQQNVYGLKTNEVFFFTARFIDTRKKATLSELQETLNTLELTMVPIVTMDFDMHGKGVKDLLAFAERSSLLNPKTEAEGVVFRGKDRPGVSFKAISNQYLLKNEG